MKIIYLIFLTEYEPQIMVNFKVFIVILLGGQLVNAIKDNSINCTIAYGSVEHFAEDGTRGDGHPEPSDFQCSYCYTLWTEDPSDGSKTVMIQGT